MRKRTLTLLVTLSLAGCGSDFLYPSVGSICAPVVNGVQSTDARATVYTFGCTGTLIAPDTVLSAAHCRERSRVELADGTRVDVVESIQHPEYSGPPFYLHDLIVYRLAHDIDLPVAPLGEPTLGPALVQGWGETETGERIGLREGLTQIVRFEAYHRVLTDSTGADSCYGDSGGPLYQDGMLVGAASTGRTSVCGEGGAYIAPLAYTEWFDSLGVRYTLIGKGCAQ